MDTQTVEQVRVTHTRFSPAVAAYGGAVAFVLAAAWFWLADQGVTVARPPATQTGASSQQAMRSYYHWLVTTLPQERYYTAIAIAGFACLAVAAIFTGTSPGRSRSRLPATIGGTLIGTGSLLWIVGSVVELGGHRAVGLMATHANPIETTNSIAFTIDTIGEAFSLAAFALIGAGMLALAGASNRSARRGWLACTVVTAVASLVTAVAYGTGNDDFSDLMLFIGGIVILPAWLIWTGRVGGFQQEPRSVS